MVGWRHAVWAAAPASSRMAGVVSTAFDRDTAVTSRGDGQYEANLDRSWWIIGGPNGGYMAAVILRAMLEEVADAERAPRSLTIQYLSRPKEGAAQLQVKVERAGRSVSSVSLRMNQGDKPIALAMGIFGTPRQGATFADAEPPQPPAPEECVAVSSAMGNAVPMHAHYDSRLSPQHMPFSGGKDAVTEGWIRLAEPRVRDALLVAAMTDAMPPAAFNRELSVAPTAGVPTLDLTIHFRATLPSPAPADEYCRFRFVSRHAHEGYMEEDGEVWSADGVLLAQSRQLALIG